MKIKMNVDFDSNIYGFMKASQPFYIVDDKTGMELISKRLNHLEMWATPLPEDPKAKLDVSQTNTIIAEAKAEAKRQRIKKRIAKLKLTAKAVETNERDKGVKKTRLAKINAELKELENPPSGDEPLQAVSEADEADEADDDKDA